MRVAIVAEFYPRRGDPVLGVWAHRQAMATRDAGAEPVVFVLHRLVPPAASLRDASAMAELARLLRQPRVEVRDGLEVHYVRYVSPPRGRGYARWGSWAAPFLRHVLRANGPFELVHAHNAVPAGDAALRASDLPLVVSVHGGDVLFTAPRVRHGAARVARTLGAARVTIANSAGIAERCGVAGAETTTVVHLGADPLARRPRSPEPLVVTVGHLVARKRHADVVRAVAELPDVRYLIVGDGPERAAIERLAAELGVADRVELTGQLAPEEARRRIGGAWLFAMPSTDEAFGVAYIEAMAAGIPAVARAGEPGPEEIAAAGPGIVVTGDLPATLRELLADPAALDALGDEAARTAAEHFSWPACGRRTLEVYERVLA